MIEHNNGFGSSAGRPFVRITKGCTAAEIALPLMRFHGSKFDHTQLNDTKPISSYE
jgi:hypothetical protein